MKRKQNKVPSKNRRLSFWEREKDLVTSVCCVIQNAKTLLWTESGLFGDTTVCHLLEGKPVCRSCKAHITTLHALFIMLLQEFLKQYTDLQEKCKTISLKLWEAWQKKDSKAISLANKSVT